MQLLEMSWPQVEQLPRETPLVIPIAALEQHGHHLPLFTDSLLLGEVVRRANDAWGERVLVAPLMWLGNSEHHLDFPGTMSASPRVYLDLLNDMVENFLFHGFRKIVLLNGHGGNVVPSQQALFEVRQRHRTREDLLLLAATYWSLGPAPDAAHPQLQQSQMGHACEWETSMMLRIRPDLVGDYASADDVSQKQEFAPGHRAWITKDRSAAGHIGQPRLASAEKGEGLLSAFAKSVVTFVEQLV